MSASRPPPLDCDCPCPLFPLLLAVPPLGELVLLGEFWSELLGGFVLLGDCELLGEELWPLLLEGLVLLGDCELGELWSLPDGLVLLGEVVLLGELLWEPLLVLGEVWSVLPDAPGPLWEPLLVELPVPDVLPVWLEPLEPVEPLPLCAIAHAPHRTSTARSLKTIFIRNFLLQSDCWVRMPGRRDGVAPRCACMSGP